MVPWFTLRAYARFIILNIRGYTLNGSLVILPLRALEIYHTEDISVSLLDGSLVYQAHPLEINILIIIAAILYWVSVCSAQALEIHHNDIIMVSILDCLLVFFLLCSHLRFVYFNHVSSIRWFICSPAHSMEI